MTHFLNFPINFHTSVLIVQPLELRDLVIFITVFRKCLVFIKNNNLGTSGKSSINMWGLELEALSKLQ